MGYKRKTNNTENDNNINEISNENEELIIKIVCKELKKNILNDKKIYLSIKNSTLVKNSNLLSDNSYIIYDIITSDRQKKQIIENNNKNMENNPNPANKIIKKENQPNKQKIENNNPKMTDIHGIKIVNKNENDKNNLFNR